jgi:hypothetical protein
MAGDAPDLGKEQSGFRGCVRSHHGAIRRIIWAHAAIMMNVSDVWTRYS